MDQQLKDLLTEKLWYEMGGVRFNMKDKIVLAEDWHIWHKGSTLEEIRSWFDNEHSRGMDYLERLLS